MTKNELSKFDINFLLMAKHVQNFKREQNNFKSFSGFNFFFFSEEPLYLPISPILLETKKYL